MPTVCFVLGGTIYIPSSALRGGISASWESERGEKGEGEGWVDMVVIRER